MSAASALTADKSALRRPLPALRIVISVAEACDELWSVQEASQAIQWLRLLHAALLRDRVDAYDPSDVFHCIQASALNFHGTWEHAIWAVAALARACVGPAWRMQRVAEVVRNNGSTATTLSESTGGSGSPRQSHSPRSFSPHSLDLQQPPCPYPYIPEVLPGAILRMAAKALPESRSLADAQRELVLSLCCGFEIFGHHERAPEWTIIGAHEPVETMLIFWLESATSSILKVDAVGQETRKPMAYPLVIKSDESSAELMERFERRTIDWWYTLHVARACSDLVSAGWRPHLDKDVIVLHLLDIVQQGITLRRISPTAVHKAVREERLAASSSAAEAIAALVSLGSRGLLPPTGHVEVLTRLVQLQVIAGRSPRYAQSLYPKGTLPSADDDFGWQQELETFLQQRSLCFADSAELLWILLAQETSTVLAMATLLADPSNDLQRAAVVVRIVSGALWGKAPNSLGILSLRIYWNEFLILLRRLAIPFLESVSNLHGNEGNFDVSKQSMTLFLEIVVAVGRMVACEMIRGTGIFASDEWDSFLQILKAVIISCLRLDAKIFKSVCIPEEEYASLMPHKIFKVIRAECEKVVMQLCDYLKQSARFEPYRYISIVDDEHRDALHLCLLREATQVVSRPTSLAIDVLRSWAAVGFLPCRKVSWVDSASAIVADAFAVYEDLSMSEYGGYVHSPMVRLEALLLLSNDVSYSPSVSDGESSQTIETFPATGAHPSPIVSSASPLSLTRRMHDDHGELVRLVIFPCLSLVFNCAIGDDATGMVSQFSPSMTVRKVVVDCRLLQLLSKTMTRETEENENWTFRLRKYSIHLIGRLYCTDLRTTEYRTQMLKILTETATMKPLQFPIPDLVGSDVLEPAQATHYVTNRSLLCLEAIGQVETCLCAAFFSYPHTHSSLPDVVGALCSILLHLSRFECLDTKELILNKQQEYSFRMLLFAALLPLARLRRSFDDGLLLVERDEAMIHTPDTIATLFTEKECDVLDDEGPFVAPFAFVNTSNKLRDPSRVTLVSFEPIVATLIDILGNSWFLTTAQDSQYLERSKDLENRFRSSCYDALTNYVMSGLTFPSHNLLGILLSFSRASGPYSATEDFTRLRASMVSLQSTVRSAQTLRRNAVPLPSVTFPWSEINDLVEQVIALCLSQRVDEVTSGCKLLIGIFPCMTTGLLEDKESLRKLHMRMLISFVSKIRDLVEVIGTDNSPEGSSSSVEEQLGPPLLLLLYECTLYYLEFFGSIESDAAMNLVRVCFDVTTTFHANRCCRTLALRCAVTVLDRLDFNDVDCLIRACSDGIVDSLTTDGIDVESNLEVRESDLILSALSYRSIVFQADDGLREKFNGAKDHFELALEFENIKAFDREKECAAAWLCGDHILTCKLGGMNSHYCGWVEITIRGATFRQRELVRLSSSVSVANSELWSSLWNEPIPPGQEPTHCSMLASPQLNGDEELLRDALDVLQQCDQLLGADPDARDDMNKQRNMTSYPDATLLASSPRCPSSDGSSHSTRTANTHEETCFPAIQTHIDHFDSNSIRAWLWESFGSLSDVEAVATRISEMGLDDVIDQGYGIDALQLQAENVALHPVIRLKLDGKAARDINLLDRTVVLDTHKVALLFAGPPDASGIDDQDEVDFLLKVQSASPSFFDFCKGLGDIVLSRHMKYFSAGFDTSGNDMDGKYALVWIENSCESSPPSSFLTIFHTVAYMPANVNNRKRHVGNDSVHVIFCDPSSFLHEQVWAGGMEEETERVLISGEFGFVTVFVIPASDTFYRVKVQLRPCLPENTRIQLQHLPGEDIVSAMDAPKFVRRLANLADIACSAVTHDTLGPPTTWEIRLRQLRQMKRHAMFAET
jgi:hypothetical protein